jgi:hypothetical protein
MRDLARLRRRNLMSSGLLHQVRKEFVMSSQPRSLRGRFNGRLLIVACVLAILLPPAAAWASQSTFVGPGASICCWTGYNDGGTFVARDYANIYHACSSYTSNGSSEIEYHNANGVPTDGDQDGPGQALCVNPGHLGSSGGNQRSVWCGAYNGGTTNVTNVTCQTTRP